MDAKKKKKMDSCPFGFAQGRLFAGMTNRKPRGAKPHPTKIMLDTEHKPLASVLSHT